MPSGRVLNSGGPPKRELPALRRRGRRSTSALYFVGGLLGDDDRVLVLGRGLVQHREGGRQRALQRGVDVVGRRSAVASLSKYCSSTPVYSGMRSIEPSCRPGK